MFIAVSLCEDGGRFMLSFVFSSGAAPGVALGVVLLLPTVSVCFPGCQPSVREAGHVESLTHTATLVYVVGVH